MPYTSNRYKNGNYVKTDKEKENLELKKRFRPSKDIQSSYVYGQTKNKPLLNTYLEKSPQSKIPPAWDRLNKLKRVSSNSGTNQLKPCKSQHNLIEKVNTRPTISLENARVNAPPTPKTLDFNNSVLTVTPCPSICLHKSDLGKKANAIKTIILPVVEKNDMEINCDTTVKPIESLNNITDVKIIKSITKDINIERSSSTKLYPRSPKYYTARKSIKVVNEMSDDSLDDYKSACNISTGDMDKQNNSENFIINNIKHILQCKERSIKPDEWAILSKMLKTDKRSCNLSKDSSELFKEILQSQLDDVVRNQVVLKSILKKMNAADRDVVNTSAQTDQIDFSNQACNPPADVPRKLEVDVVFKNIPSLERELILLRAIGQKLESGLKSHESTFSAGSLDTYLLDSRNINMFSTTSVEKIEEKEFTIKYLVFEIKERFSVVHSTNLMHALHLKGIAREFCIAYKTIMELKESANQPFYILSDSESGNLRQTSFIKLKSNPDELMRHLKSKNPYISFNILDHDPIFFNNIFYHKASRSTMGALKEDSTSVMCRSIPDKHSFSLAERHQDDRLALNVYNMNGMSNQTNVSMTTQSTANLITEKFSEEPITKAPPSQAIEKINSKKTQLKSKKISKNNNKNLTKLKHSQKNKEHSKLTIIAKPPQIKNVTATKPKVYIIRNIIIGIVHMLLFFMLIVIFTLPDMTCISF